jgi:glycosyltransferase involved in cell wall biosynthesis
MGTEQMTVKARVKPLVKALVPTAARDRELVIRETASTIRQLPDTWKTRRFEDSEVARLARELPEIPAARVVTIIATYRRPEFLRCAVRSALAQTIDDHIVIVVDDGGGLPELADDPRLFAFSLRRNSGIAGVVRNVGMRLTRSDYVAFLDDDNEWDETHLEVALAALEGADPDQPPAAIYTAVERVFADGRLMDVLSTSFDRRLLAGKSYIDTSSIVVRRFADLHFSRIRRRKLRISEDWELMFRLSRRRRVTHVPTATVRYLINPDSYYSAWSS